MSEPTLTEAEAMRAKCLEAVRVVYDEWAKNNPEERWVRVALSQALLFITWIPPRLPDAETDAILAARPAPASNRSEKGEGDA
jgi:hypothetical protein